MPSLTITLPDTASAIFAEVARRAGCPTETYVAVCALSGLAEQFRYRGEKGAAVDALLGQATQALLKAANVSAVNLTVPSEVGNIMRYEVAAKLRDEQKEV